MQQMSGKLGVSAVAMAMAAACAGSSPARLTAPGGEPAAAPAGPRCGRWVVGLDAALAGERILVLAGGQGTAETPRFVGDVVCQLGKRGPVLLAFGWPRKLASTVNLMLGGSGSAESRLRDDAMWSDEGVVAAGLGTQAMWDLMGQLEAWRAAGLDLKVATFGPDPVDKEANPYYDEDSEQYYQPQALREALRKHPDGTVVLWLDADQGASKGKGEGGETLAARLEDADFPFSSYLLDEIAATSDTSATKGAAPAAVAVPGASLAPWALAPRPELDGYHGIFRLGTTTQSAEFRPAEAAAAAQK